MQKVWKIRIWSANLYRINAFWKILSTGLYLNIIIQEWISKLSFPLKSTLKRELKSSTVCSKTAELLWISDKLSKCCFRVKISPIFWRNIGISCRVSSTSLFKMCLALRGSRNGRISCRTTDKMRSEILINSISFSRMKT